MVGLQCPWIWIDADGTCSFHVCFLFWHGNVFLPPFFFWWEFVMVRDLEIDRREWAHRGDCIDAYTFAFACSLLFLSASSHPEIWHSLSLSLSWMFFSLLNFRFSVASSYVCNSNCCNTHSATSRSGLLSERERDRQRDFLWRLQEGTPDYCADLAANLLAISRFLFSFASPF